MSRLDNKTTGLCMDGICMCTGDVDQNRHAINMILQKIQEDPQSGSCPMISYADVKGPVASSNPTGSPFANGPAQGRIDTGGMPGSTHQVPQQQGQGMFGMNSSMNNLNLNAGSNAGTIANPAVENLKATLRGSGYTEQATEEISHAIYTLASYGFLGLLGLGGLGGLGNQGYGGANQGGNLTLANLAGILGGGAPNNGQHNNGGLLGNNSQGTGASADGNPSVFGPVGSTTTTMAGGDTGEGGSSSYFATASSLASSDPMFSNYSGGSYTGAYGGTNQNSFGLGTSMGTFPTATTTTAQAGDDGATTKAEIEVGEYIVGAILGPGGRGIVELQRFTGANIQISKKGVYSPGTRNRIVTITGCQNAIQRAKYLIQQRINQEEAKRARGGSQANNVP